MTILSDKMIEAAQRGLNDPRVSEETKALARRSLDVVTKGNSKTPSEPAPATNAKA